MRTRSDRIRHAVSFEVIALALITPLAALAVDKPMHDMGVVTVVSAMVAMGWNYLYNLLFDHAMLRWAGHLKKTVFMRVLHSILFEVGLVAALLPFVAWYLAISLTEALVLDIGIALFFMVYAFVFNWVYDAIFPVPATT